MKFEGIRVAHDSDKNRTHMGIDNVYIQVLQYQIFDDVAKLYRVNMKIHTWETGKKLFSRKEYHRAINLDISKHGLLINNGYVDIHIKAKAFQYLPASVINKIEKGKPFTITLNSTMNNEGEFYTPTDIREIKIRINGHKGVKMT